MPSEATGDVYVDINAGDGGQGYMLFHAAHEYGHHIAQYAPAKFQKMVNYLGREVYGNETAKDLIDAQMAKSAADGRVLTETEAQEEMFADAMQEMFTQGNIEERLAKLKDEDHGLWQQFKDFVSKLLADIKAIYKKVQLESEEARLLKENMDAFEKIADMFTEASVEAGQKFEALQRENTEINGDAIVFSSRVTNKEELDFLNNQDYVTVYRTMQVIDGKLYSPMAAKVDGKWTEPYEIGKWYRSDERPDLAFLKPGKEGYYFKLNKGNGTSIDARYNPYEHTSNSVINDQFSSAYKRPNLVVVEMHVPKSELTSGYRAQYAKDTVGWLSWKSGATSTALGKKGLERKVLLSRWAQPVRVLSDAEVAAKYKEMLEGTGISVADNTVTPGLLAELRKIGVPITESGRVTDGQAKFSSRKEVLNRNDVDWMDDFSSIKDQLQKHRDEISKQKNVAAVEYGGEDKRNLERLILEQVKKVGGERFVRNGLTFSFDEKGIHSIVLHARTPELRAAALAAPYVAKRGILIAGQKDHEKTNTTTMTFAAPVRIDGEDTHVGVVIQFTNDGRARAVNLEYLDQGQKKKSASGLRSRTSHSYVSDLLTNADFYKKDSTDSPISQEKSSVKLSSRDAFYLKAVEDGDMETAQRMVDEAAKAAGYTMPLYHGAKKGGGREDAAVERFA